LISARKFSHKREEWVTVKRGLLAILVLFWGLMLVAACGGPRRLRIEPGETTTESNRTLRPDRPDEYVLRAQEGEILSVHLLSSDSSLALTITGEEVAIPPAETNRWTRLVPVTQDYTIRVVGGGQDAGYQLTVVLLPEHRLAEQPFAQFGGIYHMEAPTANALHDLTLLLQADGSALLIGLSGAQSLTPFSMSGTWEVAGNVATVEFTEQNGEPFPLSETIRLRWKDGVLAVRGHEEGTWRVAGIRFAPAQGDYHSMVTELHRRLAQAGYLRYDGPAPGDDLYSEQTRLAVTSFQEASGLVAHGVADAATWAALDIALLPERTPAGEPILYLTFDDGPDGTYTPQILELLNRYGAKATFFVLGEQASFFPDLIRSEAKAGHHVASHGYAHRAFDDLSRDQLYREIQRTEQLLREAAGDLFAWDGDVHFVRPPYGLTDEGMQEHIAGFGYVVVMWDVDSQDWQLPGADYIAWHVLSEVQPGDIVLMHDGGGERYQTVAALESILSELTALGYRFESIFD
jgi:peptidoglycan/xylan/chitin deacetylase (PgdA/CDA1 family)